MEGMIMSTWFSNNLEGSILIPFYTCNKLTCPAFEWKGDSLWTRHIVAIDDQVNEEIYFECNELIVWFILKVDQHHSKIVVQNDIRIVQGEGIDDLQDVLHR